MDCLDPPIEDAPPGKWHCPLCPPLPPQELDPQFTDQMQNLQVSLDPNPSDAPLGSTSRDEIRGDESTSTAAESDVDSGGEATPKTSIRKGKKKVQSKGKAVMREPQQGREAPFSPMAAFKRKRLRLSPPTPPLRSLPTIRLRLPPQPPRSKGKGREEDPEEIKRGLFDDVLTPEDRETTYTTITEKDRERFEKTRLAAEVRVSHLRKCMRS